MKQQSIWTKDFTPFLWRWLGFPLSILFGWIGVKVLIEGEIEYRGVVSTGITGLFGGIGFTLFGITMLLRRIRLGREWLKHEVILAFATAIIDIAFIVMRFVNAFKT
jgi:hypothetical protein